MEGALIHIFDSGVPALFIQVWNSAHVS